MNEEQIEENEKMTVDYTEYASVSYAIASTLATIKEVEVTELEPLHNSIDTEAIDRLFTENTSKRLVIKQIIGEYEINIRGDGTLIISKFITNDYNSVFSQSTRLVAGSPIHV